jgi:alkanesulfonate monooxygenase SsuD/methylene tetrahydromethanopterin reductase-like flavin-dependent oxidoreductase (luciferase family)
MMTRAWRPASSALAEGEERAPIRVGLHIPDCTRNGGPPALRSRRGEVARQAEQAGFERLEEALRICLQMWSDDDGPFDGKYYQLGRTLNSPQSLSRPHPPVLIGGAGEKKTLRLVARYADACNIFDTPELAHKVDILREHCASEGRDYAEIEKTAQMRFDLGERGERVEQTIEHLHQLAELGIQVAHGTLVDVGSLHPLDLMAERVIPAVDKF